MATTTYFFLLTIAFSLWGATMSRWHGGGIFPKTPKIIKNVLWATPFAIGAAILSQPWCVVIFVLVLSTIGKATGHGGFFDLGRGTMKRKDEALEFLIKWAKPKIPEGLYDFIGLSIVGVAAMSGAILSMFLIDPLCGLVVLLGGIAKGMAYGIGWEVYPNGGDQSSKYFGNATALGEGLAGFIGYLSYGLVFSVAYLGIL